MGLRGVGHGWYYPPYVYYGGYYPIYYPYFPTYGYAAWYNPWTGAYGRGAVAYGPYGGVGARRALQPAHRHLRARRGGVRPVRRGGAAQAYNPRTGTYAQTRQGSNVYGSWGSTAVQRGDDWAKTSRVTNRATGNTTRVTRTDEGAAVSRRGRRAGRQLRRRRRGRQRLRRPRRQRLSARRTGSWQKDENGGWGSVPPGSADAGAAPRRTAQQGGAPTRPSMPAPSDSSIAIAAPAPRARSARATTAATQQRRQPLQRRQLSRAAAAAAGAAAIVHG